MVAHPEDYSLSSVNANTFGRPDAIFSLHAAFLALGMDRGSGLETTVRSMTSR
jgi:hypothetical protein